MTTVLKALITADATQMKTQLKAAEGSLTAFSNKATAAGKKLTKSVTLPMVAIGGVAIKAASDFEASMTKIESLVGLSSEAVEGFTEDVRRLSGETAQAPKDLADAMFFITSAGLRGAAATETLEAAAKAAAVGLGDTATIADLATSALNAYGEANISATEATDVMVAAVREGKLEASELAGSMGRVLPIASAMGVGFDEVGAAFAALSRTGTNAAEAATQVRGILSSLLRPTKQAEDALSGMGLSAEGLREQIKDEGLLSVLKTLADRFDGNEAAAASVFGNIRALSGVMDLMGANVATTEQIFANMTNTTGALDQAFEATTDTAAFKLQQAIANLKQALIDIGNVLIPVIIPVIETLGGAISDLATGFSQLPDPIKKAAVGLGLFVAAAGPLATITGRLISPKGLPKLLGLVKAHPVAFAAATVGAVTLGTVFGTMRSRAKEAQEDMERLKAEMIDSGDPAFTLTERVDALAVSLGKITETAPEAEESISGLMGSASLLAELAERDLLTAFNQTGLDLDELTKLLMTGTDGFHDLRDVITTTSTEMRNADDDVVGVTTALADLMDNGEMSELTIISLMDAFDDVADSSDNVRKDLDAQAKAYLTSAKGIDNIQGALGDYGLELIATALQQESVHEGLEDIEHQLSMAEQATRDAQRMNGLYNQSLDETNLVSVVAAQATEEVEKKFRIMKGTSQLTAEELQEVRDEFNKLVARLTEVVDEAFGFDTALLQVKETAVDLVAAIAGLNDEEKTQLEREGDLLRASERYADALAGVGEELIGLPVEDINGFFDEQATVLDEAFKAGELAEGEYKRLTEVLGDLEQQVIDLNKREALIKIGVDTTNVPQSAIDMLFNDAGQLDLEGFGTSIAGFLGAGPKATPMATGGIVRKPQLSLIGEAGPEAVIPLDRLGNMGGTTNVTINMPVGVSGEDVVRELERYTRQEGNIQIPVSSTVRR